MLIDKEGSKFSIRKQCQLLDINLSTLYYKPVGVSVVDKVLMDLLDKQHTEMPFYGVPRMTAYLKRLGYKVGRDHVRTLLRNMGLQAIFPGKKTSKPHPEHKIYPYLLRGVKIERPNQVWSADITYIRLLQGFAYLVAIIDWFSRYVLSWRLSNTLDDGFCIEALEEALFRYGFPEIFNSDQGSQFTSNDFTGMLLLNQIQISMDGRGRVFDNIFVERFWRSVKYDNIYIMGYQNIPEARAGLKKYFDLFNNDRLHEGLGYKAPAEVYLGRPWRPGEQLYLGNLN